jgi:ceramide glucosyltransferase
MTETLLVIRDVLLGVAAIPFIYCALVLYSSIRFFADAKRRAQPPADFHPPISNLKPVVGLDPEAYENYASFCRQNYPEYEILFCIGDTNDPAYPLLEKLRQDFPDRKIRILIGNDREAVNDKVSKLARLVSEAAYEHLVISDSDVRVAPDYLSKVIAPLADPKVGATTCFYVPTQEGPFVQQLQDTGMLCDFYPGILVAWQLDGVKFALGPTIATTRARLGGLGGYAAIQNRPADDLLVGRLIAEQGVEVRLLTSVIETVPDFQSFRELFFKRLRWMTVMRHMRPWGHMGMIFTLALPWTLLAIIISPDWTVAATYAGLYLFFRGAALLIVGEWGLKQPRVWAKILYVPAWDAMATLLWLVSFTRRSIRWRGRSYRIKNGELTLVSK